MGQTHRKHARLQPDRRKQALIGATLSLLAEGGPEAATVRTIAERAGATQGLIRHHFTTKDDLVAASYKQHMGWMTEACSIALHQTFASDAARLADFITRALTPPVVDARNVALWAGFLHMVQYDPRMRAIHAKTYRVFRDRLEGLIIAALEEAGRSQSADVTARLAIVVNAVIDGLWLEGSVLPEGFDEDELPGIGLDSIEAIVGLTLRTKGH